MVQRYVAEWRTTVTRMGRWVDFDNDYKTMDPSFMESVWWVVKQLWDRGRIYKAHRVVPYSWKLTTPLSNLEASNNYQDVQDPAITVRFRLKGDLGVGGAVYALAWTTTPWTLPENQALCAGADIAYESSKTRKARSLLIAAERVSAYWKKGEYATLRRCAGRSSR
jgi:isoleucyl-tRNA synthetase